MIQLIITITITTIILLLAYFLFKNIPLPKKMIISGTVVAAAMVAGFLQFLDFAIHIPFLAIMGISMIGALGYAKFVELEKQRVMEEKRFRQQPAPKQSASSIKESIPVKEPMNTIYDEPVSEKKSFAMQTIGVNGEER